MAASFGLPEKHPVTPSHRDGNDPKREAIFAELDSILASPFFRSAARSRQFLKYVVQQQVDGHSDLLKERTIGTEVFLRPAGYATGDDPVVRVQAGEVRRRLDQYYRTPSENSQVRIELPVGSYSPVFHWPAAAMPEPLQEVVQAVPEPPPARLRFERWAIAGLCTALLLGAGIAAQRTHHSARRPSVLEQFWQPVLATQQPALICLAKGVTYRPNLKLYQRYARNHPGAYKTEVERWNDPMPLDPNEKLTWGDMQYFPDFGVATGDVSAAVRLSALLGKIGKPSQVRIGADYSFEDLRNSPAVVVGAFNNKWTMRLTSNLHFAFSEKNGEFSIREQIPGGRAWQTHRADSGIPSEDFAVVARLLDSKTGQFTVAEAGLTTDGTEAASEFTSNETYLKEGLRNAPPNWPAMNSEVVIETTVTDSVAGPPRVVATYFW